MDVADPRWSEKWSTRPFSSWPRNFRRSLRLHGGFRLVAMYGTDTEPYSSVWLASLSEALGESFAEGMRVLDYGCGVGRYAHFLAQRLADFEYFGVEKGGSRYRHGERSVRATERIFRHDGRATFGLIGSDVEEEAVGQVDTVVLGSIFTHVDQDEVSRMLAKLEPVLDRGGKIVFSIFLADEYALEGKGAYGFDDCYGRVWFTDEQVRQFAADLGAVAKDEETFVAQEVNVHRIFALTKVQTS